MPTYAGVTPQTLFRGFTTADAIGPYVSQLLPSPMNYGPYFMDGRMSMYVPDLDYMTDQTSWLSTGLPELGACFKNMAPIFSLRHFPKDLRSIPLTLKATRRWLGHARRS